MTGLDPVSVTITLPSALGCLCVRALRCGAGSIVRIDRRRPRDARPSARGGLHPIAGGLREPPPFRLLLPLQVLALGRPLPGPGRRYPVARQVVEQRLAQVLAADQEAVEPVRPALEDVGSLALILAQISRASSRSSRLTWFLAMRQRVPSHRRHHGRRGSVTRRRRVALALRPTVTEAERRQHSRQPRPPRFGQLGCARPSSRSRPRPTLGPATCRHRSRHCLRRLPFASGRRPAMKSIVIRSASGSVGLQTSIHITAQTASSNGRVLHNTSILYDEYIVACLK